ncbi:hypothetical protein BU197_29835 [Streptomyces sp. CBMA291]|nr:hypothetical protein [Streptomyces sp. CBMA291]MBD0716765.1 hypothetical protein [Streptomyces sp. CBMA370]
MPLWKQTRMAQANLASYQSSSCRIGTHLKCEHGSPVPVELGLPIVYEVCAFPCHASNGQDRPREATR